MEDMIVCNKVSLGQVSTSSPLFSDKYQSSLVDETSREIELLLEDLSLSG